MSLQKFASNVAEKCLTFGNLEERELMVKEMLGTTDENEPLQAMMKDQFGNYVVQKALETCNDQQREHIMSRIKVHLNALKKYTYGKHIVVRVEKLVTAVFFLSLQKGDLECHRTLQQHKGDLETQGCTANQSVRFLIATVSSLRLSLSKSSSLPSSRGRSFFPFQKFRGKFQ